MLQRSPSVEPALRRCVAVVLILSGVLFVVASAPAIAATCRDMGEHRICLISVERSAKNYWEYRAVVGVDGDRRPRELYDCRTKKRTIADGARVPFEANGAGELICRLLYR